VSLDLSSNKIGERGGIDLAGAVAVKPPLLSLFLANNKYVYCQWRRQADHCCSLTDAVGDALVRALKENTVIQTVDIDLNSINYRVWRRSAVVRVSSSSDRQTCCAVLSSRASRAV
jgi:hypothetical protein